MADYAGAVAAIRARFAGAFSAAPVEYQNEDPPASVWPPEGAPWVYLAVIQTASDIRGVGLPGDQAWLTLGQIVAHAFAPKGYALPEHLRIAGLAGEVFRAATFYNSDPGAKVICGAPSVRGGDSDADNGKWFVFSVLIPFEFYFLA
jgi:hypothetical protein